MRNFSLNLDECPADLRAGLAEIKAERPARFAPEGAPALRFVPGVSDAPGLQVTGDDAGVLVRYGSRTDAFRALGRVLGSGEDVQAFSETRQFDMLGAMIDVSRNGVLRPEMVKAFLRRAALMGLNMCLLYAEDTYEVPGEPFFGYLRGRYTQAELRGLDQYAAALGIEMFPCIQTLAHLEQILQWPAYDSKRDIRGVLLAEDEETYALLEKMIAAASAPFASKRIHIGMDEAQGIGTGRYKQRHGERSPFTVLNNHLKRVREICGKLGLRPMIWSDMYFCLGSKTHSYYDKDAVVPPEIARDIPQDAQLVAWDYYHTEQEFCAGFIDRHRALGRDPVMAGGVWTWNRFWAALPFSFAATDACLGACKQKGLREVFATMWGDDGMECDLFSALPGLQHFAEHGYAREVDPKLLRANFRGTCEADLDAYVKASEVDSVPIVTKPEKRPNNISKQLLWQDPLLAIMDPQLGEVSLRTHYVSLAKRLTTLANKSPEGARLRFPAQLARVLSFKCDLRKNLAAAYKSGDKAALQAILDGDLARVRREVHKLWKLHRALWLELYKPFGLEVIEQRYGGLLARLESLAERLKDFLSGQVQAIPELEVQLERIYATEPGSLPHASYPRLETPSAIK